MEIDEEIRFLRDKIDALDEQILSILNQRAEIVMEMGRIKSKSNLDTYDYRREEEILDRLRLKKSGSFPDEAISKVFREIISACRSLTKRINVAFLGPYATHTHLACLEHFGSSIEAYSKESIEDVFEAVGRGEVSYGVVPIENSIEGVVNRTLDMFLEYDLKICGEILIRISHALLSQNYDPKEIKRIYSHPQAFGQCQKWLRGNFPFVELIETSSTAKAAQMALQDSMGAAIASPIAASLYGLKTLFSQVEDFFQNYTRFLILGLKAPERTGKDKTSILFSIPHVPGSLYRVLKIFSEKRINLTKIESRPVKGRPWEYIFFIDFEGHAEDPDVSEALRDILYQVIFMRVLGSYPRR